MEKNKSIEELIYEETENRLSIMENPDYEFPKRITKVDITAIVGGIITCAVLILLCMVGVIE